MGRTVALTKRHFNKILVTTIVAKTPTAPANVHFFLFSAVFTIAFALKKRSSQIAY